MSARIGISIVTYNHRQTIAKTVESLRAQKHLAIEKIIITDNCSTDGTREVLETFPPSLVEVIQNSSNRGFCAAHNGAVSRLLAAGCTEILILNPDLRLEQSAVSELSRALTLDSSVGLVTPKLLRANAQLDPISPATFDAAGIFFTPQLRHFDRGSQLADTGQYSVPEYVFGGTGAALYFRATCIRDLAYQNSASGQLELFDESFFAYREDADLCWRAQLLGWKCLYFPTAIGFHQRVVLPERRRSLPPELNRLGVQNRFLLQFNNFSPLGQLRCLLPTLWRNTLVLGGVLLREQTSIAGLVTAVKQLPSAFRKRRLNFKKRRVSIQSMNRWFQNAPQAEPILESKSYPVSTVHALVINYNSGDRLARCLLSLERAIASLQDLAHFSVTVVDNASTDRSTDAARSIVAAHESWQMLVSRANLGFAGGINAGARRVDADAMLVLNPDVEISAEALRELVTTLSRYESIALLSPTLLSAEPQSTASELARAVQHGFTARRFPTLGSALAELFYLHRIFPKNIWTEHYLYAREDVLRRYLDQQAETPPFVPANVPYVVEQPAGACFLVRSEIFWILGGFSEEYFPAWFEDVDFCKRLSLAGHRAAVLSSARVLHEGGYSAKMLSSAQFARIWFENQSRYWMTHGTSLDKLIFQLLLPIGVLLRAIVSFFQAILEPDRVRSGAKHQLAQTLLALSFRYAKEIGLRVLGDISELFGLTLRLLQLFSKPSNQILAIPPQGQVLTDRSFQVVARNWREYFASYLNGDGLEIGALHRPLVTHEGMRVHYVDRLGVSELRAHYPELESVSLVEPEIIDDGETLNTVAERTQSFVIAAHLIEHTRNPIFAIKNWLRVLRPGGFLYLIVPDKRATFDSARVRTSLEHLILDYTQPSSERDFEHFIDYARHVSGKLGNDALNEAMSLKERDYSIHFHVFLPQDITALLQWISQDVTPLEIVQGPCAAPESDEFHLLIRKPMSTTQSAAEFTAREPVSADDHKGVV